MRNARLDAKNGKIANLPMALRRSTTSSCDDNNRGGLRARSRAGGFRYAGVKMQARRRLQRREAAGVPDTLLASIQQGCWLLNWRRSQAGPALSQPLN